MLHVNSFAEYDKVVIKGVRQYLIYDQANERSHVKAAYLHHALVLRYGDTIDIKHVDSAKFESVPPELNASFYWLDKIPDVKSVNPKQVHFFRGASLSYVAGGRAPGPDNLINMVPDWFMFAGMLIDGLGDKYFEQQIASLISNEAEHISALKLLRMFKTITECLKGNCTPPSFSTEILEFFNKTGPVYSKVFENLKTGRALRRNHAVQNAIADGSYGTTKSGLKYGIFAVPSHFKDDALFALKATDIDIIIVSSVANFNVCWQYSPSMKCESITKEKLSQALGFKSGSEDVAITVKRVAMLLEAI